MDHAEPGQGLHHQIVMGGLCSSEVLHNTDWYFLPAFQHNLLAPSSNVKKSERENMALLKLTDAIFIPVFTHFSSVLVVESGADGGCLTVCPMIRGRWMWTLILTAGHLCYTLSRTGFWIIPPKAHWLVQIYLYIGRWVGGWMDRWVVYVHLCTPRQRGSFPLLLLLLLVR